MKFAYCGNQFQGLVSGILIFVAGCAAANDTHDIASVVQNSRELLPVNERCESDFSYVTHSFIDLACSESMPAAAVGSAEGGEAATHAWQDFGNSYFLKDGIVHWKQGDKGSVESYSCGTKYTRSHRPSVGFSISVQGTCAGGKKYYRFGY